jgi:hypothetical protein
LGGMVVTTSSPIAAYFTYRLLKQKPPVASPVTDGLMEVYTFGLPSDQQRRYYLEISAKSGFGGDVGLGSVDLTLNFDSDLFELISDSDVSLTSSPLSQLQRKAVMNAEGTSSVRFAVGSAEAISDASGLALGQAIRGDSQVLGYVTFDLKDQSLSRLLENEGYLDDNKTKRTESAGFHLSANVDETVFTDLQSLRDKLNAGYVVDAANLDIKAAAVTMQLSQQNGHRFGTQRTISLLPGDSGFTNLIREGDTVSATARWKNTGDVSVTGINVASFASGKPASFSLATAGSTNSISVGDRAADGTIIDANRQSGDITINLTADFNAAGKVIDTSSGLYTLKEASTYFDWTGKGSKNLITYQGDLNYDGRVSMKDLAYLNAGAAKAAAGQGIAGDVDANHDNAFSIADLAILDRDWGKTLHSGSQAFKGTTAPAGDPTQATISWAELAQQTSFNEQSQGMAMQWQNPNFEIQNSLEASGVFDPAPYRPAES